MSKIIIVGGGASGLFATVGALNNQNEVLVLEKNEKLGKKIYITGKGRCNLTNNVSIEEFLNNVVVNSKFLFSSINSLSPESLIDFFESNGLTLKTERGNRVFPFSDKASDVTKCLEKYILSHGAKINYSSNVKSIIKEGNLFKVETETNLYTCDNVIVCTGGLSYPSTGSTGDGLIFAKKFGHSVISPVPSLVGINLDGENFKPLQGLSLKNVEIKLFNDGKCVFQDFGEMLFTHFGVSGPIVLSSSAHINRLSGKIKMSIDLKPALNTQVLNARIVRDCLSMSKKNIANLICGLAPKSLVALILKKSKIALTKKCGEITKEERVNLVNTLKSLEFVVKSLRPLEEAIITSGGINVKEINPKTMESKIVKGLYFAGEVLDVDAYTGGFNLQIAFSTGYLAGKSV